MSLYSPLEIALGEILINLFNFYAHCQNIAIKIDPVVKEAQLSVQKYFRIVLFYVSSITNFPHIFRHTYILVKIIHMKQ